MKILQSIKTNLNVYYRFSDQTVTIYTYLIEKEFLFWRWRVIKQVLPDLPKPYYDCDKIAMTKIKLTAQRDYQMMWERK